MAAEALDVGGARLLVEKVRRDRTLDERYRRRAARLAPMSDKPALVLARLQRTAREVLPGLPRRPPATDLARVVTAAVFLRYHALPEVREAFLSAEDFIRYVDAQPDKSTFLRQVQSKNEPLFPWDRSWMADWHAVRGLTGVDLDRALELDKRPPFVVFVFPRSACAAYDITVRRPCSLDSVLGPHLQWREGGPLSGLEEYVDGDLAAAAVSDLHWVA